MIKNARLISWNKIEVEMSNENDNPHFDFFISKQVVLINYLEKMGAYYTFSFYYDKEILGNRLYVKDGNHEVDLDVTKATEFDGFDEGYYFDDELGCKYTPERTYFTLWAPLASSVILRVNDNEYDMKRGFNGVYRAALDGDHDGELYDFVVTINGKEVITSDPYGKSSNANNKKSAVINFDKVKSDSFRECLPPFKENVEVVIYEAHIKDMTTNKGAEFKNRGKFLGLIEKGCHTKGGNPAGFDYLANLGFSHLQLLPVLDFGSVDEHDSYAYNWGYDPISFFNLEGSYSTNPDDPYSRIKEFKRLVSTFHRVGIRINLDVVYNHIYKLGDFAANLITPNYYFRKRDGKLSNRSGCGNDFASERPMARKMIVDSIKYLLNEYDVDGFRFDLMGLLDVETMRQVSEVCEHADKKVMVYGEGWNMENEGCYEGTLFANMDNAKLLPNVAFFNDRYRNIVRGLGSKAKLDENGYLLGNLAYLDGFEFAYRGATKDVIYPHLFASFNQSLNYVECHDNATLYDVISESVEDAPDSLYIIKVFNKVLLFSPGIPFIHMGQEIGLSKHGQSNTYNMGPYYNEFDYEALDERMEFVNSVKSYIEVRKMIPLFTESNSDFVNSNITVNTIEDGLEIILNSNHVYHIFINPNNHHLQIHVDKEMELFAPLKIRKYNEKISINDIGIAPKRCSIYKETNDVD